MNWEQELRDMFEENGDDFSKMTTTLSEDELKAEFNDGYGSVEGAPFTAWGENFVYFPLCYDGSEWVGSAPRNPCDKKLKHQGGRWKEC